MELMHREVPSPTIIIYESIYPMDKLKKTHQHFFSLKKMSVEFSSL